jgi:hypothetical protein
VYEAAVVGDPDTVPVLSFRVKPAGREPELIDQVYGVSPPVAANVKV